MIIRKRDLEKAVTAGIIDQNHFENLLKFIKKEQIRSPRFNFTHVLYYAGGLIAIGAMTLFMNLGWEQFGGWGIVCIGLLYACFGLVLTEWFRRREMNIPAGICAAFVVALTPLIIFGVQKALGFWPDNIHYRSYYRVINWCWIFMEFGTLFTGSIALFRYRYPFMLLIISVTLWFLSMDCIFYLFDVQYPDFELRKFISLWFGLLMLLLAFLVDYRSLQSKKPRDYAFWLYLFGMLTFWGALTWNHSSSEWAKFGYFTINLLLILIGTAIRRKVFVIFGGIGTTTYLGHLAWDVFAHSWGFPIALSAIGFGTIFLGILWQKHETELAVKMQKLLPEKLACFIDRDN